jgi:hypothetical protein
LDGDDLTAPESFNVPFRDIEEALSVLHDKKTIADNSERQKAAIKILARRLDDRVPDLPLREGG